jgi:hypothetical protein
MPRTEYREIKAISTLPKRIITLRTIDCGPMEEGSSDPTGNCPHCGAGGRWIHVFLCDDGLIYGAMSGCINLFGEGPKTKLAIMGEKAMDKEKELIRASAKGSKKTIAKWFTAVLDALRDLELGTITLEEAEKIGMNEYSKRNTWLLDNGFIK